MNYSKMSFIKNRDLLKEDCKVDDLLDFSEYKDKLNSKLESIKTSSLLGYVGGFGKGKSTLIYQIKKENDKQAKWIDFDAWKFPDRKDLWEGFVLEFASQINDKKLKETVRKIDGKKNDDKETLISTLASIPGLASLNNLNHFLDKSPAKRVFEIQAILTGIINEIDQDIFIVVEDIDRSGDAGIFFLETLNQFIKNLDSEKRVVAIIPISDKKFEYKIDSYLKCLDYIDFFDPKVPSLYKFVEEIFDDGDQFIGNETYKSQISSFFNGLFRVYPDTTMRLIKLILRKSEMNYINMQNDGYEPDWRTTIAFETSKYFNRTDREDALNEKWFYDFKENKIIRSGSLFTAFFDILECDSHGFEYEDIGDDIHKQGEIVFPKNDIRIVPNKECGDSPNYPYRVRKYRTSESDSEYSLIVVRDYYLGY